MLGGAGTKKFIFLKMLDEVGIKKLFQFNMLREADTKNLFSLEMIDGICKEKAPLAQYVWRNCHENALFLKLLGELGIKKGPLARYVRWGWCKADSFR